MGCVMAPEDNRLELAHSMAARFESGSDVVIVCTGTEKQANYWQNRLEAARGSVLKSDCEVYCVNEDWGKGGAGNGLGTLYAYTKAENIARANGKSLIDRLKNKEISVAMYHTAGKGTRLAPLPGSENNNKPGVKLPASVNIAGEERPITILESVIRQTNVYAECRKGRLSVYWGDQVFIPTAPTTYDAKFHVDILCSLLPTMPSAQEWVDKSLQSYGLIATSSTGEAAQVEKVSHDKAQELLASMGTITSVGPSLGSFSVSATILELLLAEFSSELAAKASKLDTDPHFWMPITLALDGYCDLMASKGMTNAEAKAHWERMQEFKSKLSGPIFGAVDVGEDMYWWDYGQLKKYVEFNLIMAKDSKEAAAMRAFFGTDFFEQNKQPKVTAKVDEHSVLSGVCSLQSGSVKNSVLTSVKAGDIRADGALLSNVSAKKINAAKNSVCYNVVDTSPEGITLREGEAMVGVWQANGDCVIMRSQLSIDGGKAWDRVLEECGNKFSYADIMNQNMDVDPAECDVAQSRAHAEFSC